MKWKANEVSHVVSFVPAKNDSFYLRVSNKLYASRIATKLMWSVCIGKAESRKAISSVVLFSKLGVSWDLWELVLWQGKPSCSTTKTGRTGSLQGLEQICLLSHCRYSLNSCSFAKLWVVLQCLHGVLNIAVVWKNTLRKANVHKGDRVLQLYLNKGKESTGARSCRVFSLGIFKSTVSISPELLATHCPLPFPLSLRCQEGRGFPNCLPHTPPSTCHFTPKS